VIRVTPVSGPWRRTPEDFVRESMTS
jgi:hypothetical protein